MKIIKTCVLAAALSAAATTAFADIGENIKLYGVIDEGILVHRSPGEKTNVSMDPGITKGNRWGIDGKEDLGSGYELFFRLEAGFYADTGATRDSDYAFYRDSYVGVSTPVGKFNVGRTGALASGNNGGILGQLSPFGITWDEAGIHKIFVGQISARVSNMVRYESESLVGLKFYAQYSNGVTDDAVDWSQKDRYLAVGVTYRAGGLRLVALFDNTFWNDSLDPAGGDSAGKGLKDMRTYSIGGSYDFGPATLILGYQFGQNVKTVRKGDLGTTAIRNASTTSNSTNNPEGYTTHAGTIGTNIKLLGGTVKGVVGYVHSERHFNDSEANVLQFALGYQYPLSKRTYVYAAVDGLRATAKSTRGKESGWSREIFAGMCHNF